MEDELIFKRFPAEKQDQVRQLVEYATLMGLSGKDLVSIGGKLDRLKQAIERKANMEIVNGFECLPIGIDTRRYSRNEAFDRRFKLKTAVGSYNFENIYGHWKVTSLKTKTVINHRPDEYEYALGTMNWQRRSRYAVLLDISRGKLVLNF